MVLEGWKEVFRSCREGKDCLLGVAKLTQESRRTLNLLDGWWCHSLRREVWEKQV